MKDLLLKYSGHLTNTDKPESIFSEGPNSIHEQIYVELRDSILSCVLEPSQPLNPDRLAMEMAVSQTPVNEALLRLESDSLVDFNPVKGFAVASFSLDDLKEIYYLRGLLEGMASYLAANNLTGDDLDGLEQLCDNMDKSLAEQNFEEIPLYNAGFHETIYRAAKSPRLYRMIVHLWNSFPKSSISLLTVRAPVSVEQHRAIYQALRDHDPERARSLTRQHLAGTLEDLADYWSFV